MSGSGWLVILLWWMHGNGTVVSQLQERSVARRRKRASCRRIAILAALRGVVTSTYHDSRLRTHLYHPSRAQMLGVLRIVHNEQRLSMHRH